MRAISPQARFLLRGSGLLIALLSVWWVVLLNPMLFLLRGAVGVCGAVALGADSQEFVREAPNGDWSVRVPLRVTIPPNPPAQPRPTSIDSVDFDIARADAVAFTFSLPVFWAIMLAAPGIRRQLRPLAYGTLLIGILEIVLFLAFAWIFAQKIAAGLSAPGEAAVSWHLRFGEYLIVGVIPYVAPVLAAFALHRDLRSKALAWGSGPQPQPPRNAAARAARRR